MTGLEDTFTVDGESPGLAVTEPGEADLRTPGDTDTASDRAPDDVEAEVDGWDDPEDDQESDEADLESRLAEEAMSALAHGGTAGPAGVEGSAASWVLNNSAVYVSYGGVLTGGPLYGGVRSGAGLADDSVRPVERGPVQPDTFRLVREVFAEPGWYRSACARLAKRVLFLEGPDGVGKTTGALMLLAERNLERTVSFEPYESPARFPAGTWGTEQGHLIDDLPAEQVEDMSRQQVDRVAGELREREAYLVVTVARNCLRSDVREEYAVDVRPPDAREALRRHLGARLGWDDEERWREQLFTPDTEQALDETQLPRRVAELAAELLAVVRTGRSVEQALESWQALPEKEAPDLFDHCVTPEDRAMLLAVSAFEGYDYEVVAGAARRLHRLAGDALGAPGWNAMAASAPGQQAAADSGDSNPGGDSLFGRTRTQRLETVGARQVEGAFETRGGSRYRLEPVRFAHADLGRAVLTHVWREHGEVRKTLLSWLAGTPSEREQHLRAAVVAGTLLAQTSGYHALRPLRAWARSSRDKHRLMAAQALGAAAEDPAVGTQARTRLLAWETARDRRLRHAAALAYGLSYGRDRPTQALRGLGRIAAQPDDEDGRAHQTVRDSMLALATISGLLPRVLTELERWTRGPSFTRAVAAETFAALVHADAGRPLGGQGLGPLPVQARQESVTDAVVGLLRRGLDDSACYPLLRDALAAWDAAGADDPELSSATGALLSALLDGESGRGVVRLAMDIERQRMGGDRPDGVRLRRRARDAREAVLNDRVAAATGGTRDD